MGGSGCVSIDTDRDWSRTLASDSSAPIYGTLLWQHGWLNDIRSPGTNRECASGRVCDLRGGIWQFSFFPKRAPEGFYDTADSQNSGDRMVRDRGRHRAARATGCAGPGPLERED